MFSSNSIYENNIYIYTCVANELYICSNENLMVVLLVCRCYPNNHDQRDMIIY